MNSDPVIELWERIHDLVAKRDGVTVSVSEIEVGTATWDDIHHELQRRGDCGDDWDGQMFGISVFVNDDVPDGEVWLEVVHATRKRVRVRLNDGGSA